MTFQLNERISGRFTGSDDVSAVTDEMSVPDVVTADCCSPHRRLMAAQARLRSASFVSMVETADLRDRHDAPGGW